ncbi:hypothetical protein M422DRAFT_254367 [Sphaerobolus stellatus SS14]|uniref:Uncharacterized protein n=1 Tax=Sphaerobolus stellatus (strain SS14) TaxID=990650 RepID=A0A0C9VW91_SPHS4|nr:hypothetical protein M422DRAFT_254367 [Sphaerobolus stellatus SS14]
MSFTHICGNFQLHRYFRRNPIDDAADASGYHLHYESTFVTNSGNILVDIRIYQLPQYVPHPEGTIAFIFGKFRMSGPYSMEIEAVHIFKYPSYVTGRILPTFTPRVTIAGHVLQDVQQLSNGTKLIVLNTMDFVRDYHQVVTVIAAMAPNNRWPIEPPTPKRHIPIRIPGFIDCIDNKWHLPVIIVEELTLELGNKRVAELANHARIERLLILCKAHPARETETAMEPIMADKDWIYATSAASLSSIPPYGSPYPLPFPLDSSVWGRSKPTELKYLPLRYPAPQLQKLSDIEELEEGEFREQSNDNGSDAGEDLEKGEEDRTCAGEKEIEDGDSIESEEQEDVQQASQRSSQIHTRRTFTAIADISQEFPFPSSQAMVLSDATISDDEESVQEAAKKTALNNETVYLEDIPVVPRVVDRSSSKKRKTPPKAVSTSHMAKKNKPLPPSQPTLNKWIINNTDPSDDESNSKNMY